MEKAGIQMSGLSLPREKVLFTNSLLALKLSWTRYISNEVSPRHDGLAWFDQHLAINR